MTRYCSRCATEVDDRGGYCALGHRLKLDPIDGSIESLRAEIDQVFEAARLEVSGVVPAQEATAGVAPAPPPAATAPQALAAVPSSAATDDIPSEEALTKRARGVWAALEEDVDINGDPIEAFAPPPRMDWGPKRAALRGRLSAHGRPSSATV
ncbi:MAG: hypothetical protein ACRDJV_13875 [Actinomycetota bacterium]